MLNANLAISGWVGLAYDHKLCDQKSLILQVFFAQVSPHEDFC